MARDPLVIWGLVFGILGALDVIRQLLTGFTSWWNGLTAGSQLALVIVVFILIAKRKKR